MVDYYSMGCLLYELLVGIPPYYNTDRQTMYNNIVYQHNLEFPPDVPKDAVNLIAGLLNKNPLKRLGS